jgi:hypothetical protein
MTKQSWLALAVGVIVGDRSEVLSKLAVALKWHQR